LSFVDLEDFPGLVGLNLLQCLLLACGLSVEGVELFRVEGDLLNQLTLLVALLQLRLLSIQSDLLILVLPLPFLGLLPLLRLPCPLSLLTCHLLATSHLCGGGGSLCGLLLELLLGLDLSQEGLHLGYGLEEVDVLPRRPEDVLHVNLAVLDGLEEEFSLPLVVLEAVEEFPEDAVAEGLDRQHLRLEVLEFLRRIHFLVRDEFVRLVDLPE